MPKSEPGSSTLMFPAVSFCHLPENTISRAGPHFLILWPSFNLSCPPSPFAPLMISLPHPQSQILVITDVWTGSMTLLALSHQLHTATSGTLRKSVTKNTFTVFPTLSTSTGIVTTQMRRRECTGVSWLSKTNGWMSKSG